MISAESRELIRLRGVYVHESDRMSHSGQGSIKDLENICLQVVNVDFAIFAPV